MMLVGVAGYARAGKDTVGQLLGQMEGCERVAFADKLKAVARFVNPHLAVTKLDAVLGNWRPVIGATARLDTFVYNGADEDWLKENTDYRSFLQDLGQAVRDELGALTWVHAALADAPENAVITDVRYPNEADAVRAAGGLVWRVNRPGTGPANDHISEHAMDDYAYDAVIENDGSYDDLARKVAGILEGT